MAIIKPQRTFEGGNMEDNKSFSYIKDEVPQIKFTKNENVNGAYVVILPAYKLDSLGAGVWYRVATLRADFGSTSKEKYLVQGDDDPVNYFARSMRKLYPDLCQVTEEVTATGKKFKKYPAFGRITKRVFFNAAYCPTSINNSWGTPSLLDLPQFNGGAVIDNWHKTPDLNGNLPDLVCDPDKAVPIFIKLDLEASGNPWKINIQASTRFPIPPELASSDNLINLDTVDKVRDKEYLIQKLREMYPVHFDKVMTGYDLGPTQVAIGGIPEPEFTPQSNPVAQAAPVVQAPSVSNIQVPVQIAETRGNPLAGVSLPTPQVDPQAAADFLRR